SPSVFPSQISISLACFSRPEFPNLDAATLSQLHESAAVTREKLDRHFLGSITNFDKPVGGPMRRHRVLRRHLDTTRKADDVLADVVSPEVQTERKVNYGIAPLLIDRWSPRSMTGEPLADEDLFPLLEAARWAPSSYNGQLWRFIIARRQNQEDF